MDAAVKRILAVLLFLTLAACAPSPTPPPAPVEVSSPAPSAVSALTAEQVRNASVSLSTLTGDTPITYQLLNGTYNLPNGNGSINLLDPLALGDLDHDGAGDAAALIAENYGGSGTFVSLIAFRNENGQPVQVAITPIDDRPQITSLRFDAGQVALEATVHSFEDPMCCPTLQTKRHYALFGSSLILRDFSTLAADGRWREIQITSPQDGEGMSSVQIQGTVTISPFENSLVYHVFDAAGNELAVGPVAVTAAELGALGTFDAVIALNGISSGSTVRIEIQDVSAADGSLLAMDSVILTVK